MGQKYTVQVLDEKEWASLPYEGIEDSHGFADVKKGMAFVRNSGSAEFDLGTIAHEVNHLIEKHGKDHPDWESGVLHKKGGAARSVLPAVLGGLATIFAGPVGGALVGGLSNVGMDQYAKGRHPNELGQKGKLGDMLGAGALGALSGVGAGTALKGGIAGGSAAAPGFLSKAGGIASGAAFGTAPTAVKAGSSGLLGSGGKFLGSGSLAAKGVPSGTSAMTSNIMAPGQAAANAAKFGAGIGMGSSVSAIPQAGLGLLGQVSAFNSLNSGASIPSISLAPGGVPSSTAAPQQNLLGGSARTASSTGGLTPLTPAPAAAKAFSFKDLVTPSNIMGAGSLLGAMATPSPQFEMPDSVELLRSKLMTGQGLSPLGQQAQLELGNIMKSSPSELYSPANDAYYAETNRVIDQQYEQAKRQLDAAYNNAGMLGSGEYMSELRKLNEAQANAKSSFAETENQRRFELARTDKYRAIQDSLGVDKNTMDNLIGLTGLDVQQAAMIYGAKAADVQSIREALGTIGTEMLLKNQSPTQQSFMNTPLL